MAKDKPKASTRMGGDGRRVTSADIVRRKGAKDKGGFKSKGFKSEGFTGRAPEKKPRPGQTPPSTREKERKGGPPSKRPSVSKGKKKPPSRWAKPPEGWGSRPSFPKPKPRKPKKPMPLPPGPRKPKKPLPRPKGKRPTPKKPMKRGG